MSNKHIGSELDSLFEELGEAEEKSKLAKEKIINILTEKNRELEILVENLRKNNAALTKNNLRLSKELKDIQKEMGKKK